LAAGKVAACPLAGGGEFHPVLFGLGFTGVTHRLGPLRARGHFIPRLGGAFTALAYVVERGGIGGGVLFGGTGTVECGVIGQGLLLSKGGRSRERRDPERRLARRSVDMRLGRCRYGRPVGILQLTRGADAQSESKSIG